MGLRAQGLKHAWALTAVIVATATVATVRVAHGQPPVPHYQEMFTHGQNIAPAYEGWEENSDGTYNFLFGYFNRNWEEQPDVPVGPNNTIEPGGPDRGQPTHFFPRRNKFVFRVKVPKEFYTKNQELVWTLTVNGKAEKAYATFKPDYKLEKQIIQTNANMQLGIPGMEKNNAPAVKIDGDTRRTVKVGEPLSLTAIATDDAFPKPRAAPKSAAVNDTTAMGLRVAWFVYRGAGKVTFTPEQFKVYQDKRVGGNSPWTPGWLQPSVPADGKYPVTVTFSEPGTYMLRVMAHDGGLDDVADATVTVTAASTASR